MNVPHDFSRSSGASLPVDTAIESRIGGYLLTRPLGSGCVGDRFLALHEQTQSSHVAHRLAHCASKVDRSRIEAAFGALGAMEHPHILRLEAMIFEDSTPWIITPFAGDADGLRTLGRLLRQKGGQMAPLEAGIAISQLLHALDYAHSTSAGAPVFHGLLVMDEVLVDRHGRLIVELFGMSRRLKGLSRGNLETGREEVARVVELGYELITGLRAEDPIIPAQRLAPKLSRAWSQWLDRGLDPSRGFQTARQALDLLPIGEHVEIPPAFARSSGSAASAGTV